jgi:hypothetical protein
MSRSKQSSENSERLARLEAEDRAVTYLETFSPYVAFAIALVAEAFLAKKWSSEQSKMMHRGDTREAFWIDDGHLELTRQARKLVPPDVEVDIIAMNRVLALLAGFPPDRMWMSAFTVAWQMGVRAVLGERKRFHDFMPNLYTSAQMPEIHTREGHEHGGNGAGKN